MTEIPPGNYPPPPAGGLPPAGGPPNNNLVLGILVTIFCCLPFGIVSIVKATQVSGLWAQGQFQAAQTAADEAKKWATWGAIAGAVVLVIYLVFTFVIGAASYGAAFT
ncbi:MULTISPECIES: CD225/dispanin family protein [Mycobacteriaceae]|uniref:CD225/dispanin family protein n=1 Tax=Mycolicibacterium mucogenicum DSM 44124 TaxID=1226753 RepID=A0A8H2PGA3_MYCMU|nr:MULTISPECIES: CD225/dispanin family protein [Mycobacteriaceae]KAB7754883.1 interferon-induced transmembrane protein [Mycolicibacterium mucogenicum DSM 44124]MDX1878345.1 CD225/dispanin family protein [Mycolicibacterium sp. 141076]QPG71023.1 CD225/dispanin family protein [Mycolicibacterium mucogenicum DSM 44124]SEB07080.1 Interferon-induced transmembrane protein [Mycobacterium sp. 283mftsu]